jgi:hypothetical protein
MGKRQIEKDAETTFGPCQCCGGMTRRIWGYISFEQMPEAAYFVEWTIGNVKKHGAMFDMIIGKWGENSTKADRVSVSVEMRHFDTGPEFMIVDSAEREVFQERPSRKGYET